MPDPLPAHNAADSPHRAPAPRSKPAAGKDSPFYVPHILHSLGGLVERYRDFWLWLGRVETSLVAQDLRRVPIKAPVYVSGLARSGSTILHEIVSAHPGVATHRIKDYPMVFTPYWWRRATAKLPAKAPHERPHRDRVMITTDSPDAVEEMLWMAFFPKSHDPQVSNVLGAGVKKPAFEEFYRAHLRKLLLAEKATRYAAKANYHIMRLGYLVRLFPDAKFVLPVRAPAGHIASLLRQHQWFSAGHRQHPRGLAFMQRSGHFEFGLDRRPINLGDDARVQDIQRLWAAGDEVRGLARYWAMVYGYLAQLLASDAKVKAATIVVRYETLCKEPSATLRAMLTHCALPEADKLIARFAPGISEPVYYKSPFSPDELKVIETETANVAAMWGYAAR